MGFKERGLLERSVRSHVRYAGGDVQDCQRDHRVAAKESPARLGLRSATFCWMRVERGVLSAAAKIKRAKGMSVADELRFHRLGCSVRTRLEEAEEPKAVIEGGEAKYMGGRN
jgi:hypothetical protein